MRLRLAGMGIMWFCLAGLSVGPGGCKRAQQANPEQKGGAPMPGRADAGKPSPIRDIMVKLTKGPQSLNSVIGEELKADSLPWDKLQAQTKEFTELARSMAKYDPPKGSKEAWTKQTAAYSQAAANLEKAVSKKDKDAALTAHRTLSGACMGCHREHRLMAGPPGAPPGFMPKGFDRPRGPKKPNFDKTT